MNLFYRKYGSGSTPLFILHGLFGQSDNWQTVAKALAEKGHEVYTVDQRNHGMSPHSDNMNYPAMAKDLYELITGLGFSKANVLGHSMGGKTAMLFSSLHPEKTITLIVADIAPKFYPPHHQQIIAALNQINFKTANTRKAVDEQLSVLIPDNSTKQFLLKNLYWKSDTELDWRFNLSAIEKHIKDLGAEIQFTKNKALSPACTTADFETCFIRGQNSRYILDSDWMSILQTFPDATLETIAGAGHWLHADRPKEFIDIVHSHLLVQG